MWVNKSPGNWKLVTICHEKGGSFSNVEAAEPQWSPLANTVRIWPPLSLLTEPVEGPKSWGYKEIEGFLKEKVLLKSTYWGKKIWRPWTSLHSLHGLLYLFKEKTLRYSGFSCLYWGDTVFTVKKYCIFLNSFCFWIVFLRWIEKLKFAATIWGITVSMMMVAYLLETIWL